MSCRTWPPVMSCSKPTRRRLSRISRTCTARTKATKVVQVAGKGCWFAFLCMYVHLRTGRLYRARHPPCATHPPGDANFFAASPLPDLSARGSWLANPPGTLRTEKVGGVKFQIFPGLQTQWPICVWTEYSVRRTPYSMTIHWIRWRIVLLQL